MLHGQLRGQHADPELLYVAAMYHDLGMVEGHMNLEQRFEVDGADAARAFLDSHQVPHDDARRVWTAIALHTTHGIPVFMEPEIALLAAGVETDVDGAGLDLLEPADVKDVVAAHPRMDFKRQSLPTFDQIPTDVGELRYDSERTRGMVLFCSCLRHQHSVGNLERITNTDPRP